MIFQGFKYLDWEVVNQAAQSIRKTACQWDPLRKHSEKKNHEKQTQKTNQSQISNWVGSACYARLFTETLNILPHRLFINQENGMK